MLSLHLPPCRPAILCLFPSCHLPFRADRITSSSGNPPASGPGDPLFLWLPMALILWDFHLPPEPAPSQSCSSLISSQWGPSSQAASGGRRGPHPRLSVTCHLRIHSPCHPPQHPGPISRSPSTLPLTWSTPPSSRLLAGFPASGLAPALRCLLGSGVSVLSWHRSSRWAVFPRLQVSIVAAGKSAVSLTRVPPKVNLALFSDCC